MCVVEPKYGENISSSSNNTNKKITSDKKNERTISLFWMADGEREGSGITNGCYSHVYIILYCIIYLVFMCVLMQYNNGRTSITVLAKQTR